jgi:hypothetical protein
MDGGRNGAVIRPANGAGSAISIISPATPILDAEGRGTLAPAQVH